MGYFKEDKDREEYKFYWKGIESSKRLFLTFGYPYNGKIAVSGASADHSPHLSARRTGHGKISQRMCSPVP